MVARNELMIVTGQLLAYSFNAFIAVMWPHAHVWRWMLVICSVPAVALWIGIHLLPESPRWLANKRRTQEMWAVLNEVRMPDEVEAEGEDIVRRVEEEARIGSGSWSDFRVPWIRKITLIGIGLAALSQLTGVNGIMYYAPTILETTGLGTQAALVATIANGVVSVVAVAIGIGLLKRLPRKRMMIIGQTGVVVSLVMLGFMFLLPTSTVRSYLVLLFMLTFLFSMQCFIGPTFWLMLAEIFPMRVRGLANGVAVFCNWMGNVIVAFAFPNLIAAVQGNTFFVFAVINALTLAFYARLHPTRFPSVRHRPLGESSRRSTRRQPCATRKEYIGPPIPGASPGRWDLSRETGSAASAPHTDAPQASRTYLPGQSSSPRVRPRARVREMGSVGAGSQPGAGSGSLSLGPSCGVIQ